MRPGNCARRQNPVETGVPIFERSAKMRVEPLIACPVPHDASGFPGTLQRFGARARPSNPRACRTKQPAAVEHRNPLGELFDFGQRVRGKQHSSAVLDRRSVEAEIAGIRPLPADRDSASAHREAIPRAGEAWPAPVPADECFRSKACAPGGPVARQDRTNP